MLFKICSIEPNITTWYNVFSDDGKSFLLIRSGLKTDTDLSRPLKLFFKRGSDWEVLDVSYPDLVLNLQKAIEVRINV